MPAKGEQERLWRGWNWQRPGKPSEATRANQAGKLRNRCLRVNERAHAGVNAVSANEQVSADLASIGKLRRNSLRGALRVQEPLARLNGDAAPDGFVTQGNSQFSPFNGQSARISAQFT